MENKKELKLCSMKLLRAKIIPQSLHNKILNRIENEGHYNTKYPRCKCGHPKSQHNNYLNKKSIKTCIWHNCDCKDYKAQEIGSLSGEKRK